MILLSCFCFQELFPNNIATYDTVFMSLYLCKHSAILRYLATVGKFLARRDGAKLTGAFVADVRKSI